jgi:hypothetical protein
VGFGVGRDRVQFAIPSTPQTLRGRFRLSEQLRTTAAGTHTDSYNARGWRGPAGRRCVDRVGEWMTLGDGPDALSIPSGGTEQPVAKLVPDGEPFQINNLRQSTDRRSSYMVGEMEGTLTESLESASRPSHKCPPALQLLLAVLTGVVGPLGARRTLLSR